jgi:hypothetical protein
MDETSPAGAVIFESYGRADAQQVATQIKASLKQNGYDVWLDVEQIPQTEAPDKSFWFKLQVGLQKSKVVLALLSPRSVRLAGDIDDWMSVCHNELIFAVDHGIPVVSVRVVNCHPPGVINHYETIEFLDWQSSPDVYDKGIEEIVQWLDEALSGRHRHRPFVAKLSSSRLPFPWIQPAGTSFVGRDWLLQDLTSFLKGESPCLLIIGGTGSGKTALSAQLVGRHFDEYNSGLMLAYHYCGRDPRTRNAQRFVLSIAGMLSMTVPGYEQRLRTNETFVDALGTADPETMLTQGVLAALGEERLDQPHYIIVDALDEAALPSVDRAASQISIPRLLANATDKFPPWLKLVVTSRPIDEVRRAFHMAEQRLLGASVAEQLQDVEEYLRRRVGEPPLSERIADKQKLVTAVTQRSAGNFQYAKTVLDGLDGGKLAPDNIDTLPESLAGLYDRLAEARFLGTDFEPARLVLGVLLGARQPLSQEQLALVTGLDRSTEVRVTLDLLSLFVTWDEATGERLYRVSHESIADWLRNPPDGSDRFRVDLPKAHQLILAHCRGWNTHHETFALKSYALTHLIGHLLESDRDRGALTEAMSVVRAGFFDRRRRHGVNQWHELDDTRALALALIDREDQAAILELARTSNIPQRDGVASALQSAPPDANAFVNEVVGKLLAVH